MSEVHHEDGFGRFPIVTCLSQKWIRPGAQTQSCCLGGDQSRGRSAQLPGTPVSVAGHDAHHMVRGRHTARTPFPDEGAGVSCEDTHLSGSTLVAPFNLLTSSEAPAPNTAPRGLRLQHRFWWGLRLV